MLCRADADRDAVGELINAMSPRAARLLAVGLLLLAFMRMASLVLAQPIVGFANQFDMHRTSACVGVWPDDVPIGQASPEAPRERYRLSASRASECYPSTQVAVVWVATVADRVLDGVSGSDPKTLSLRAVGITGLLLWLLAAAWLASMWWSRTRLLIAHAAVSALLIADPFNTLYLNTLYTEFPALLAAYFAGAIVLSLWDSASAPWRRLLALSVCLILLGGARVQHLALPFVFVIFALLALWRAQLPLARAASLLLGISAALVVVQVSQQAESTSIARANLADAVLGAAMPAGDPERIAAQLGLPSTCADLAYSTWYRQHGVDLFTECPQLAEVSRLRMLWVSVRDPSVFARMLLRGVLMSQHLRLGYLGERGDGDYAVISSADNLLWFGLDAPLNRLPPTLFLFAMSGLLIVVPMFWLNLMRQGRAGVSMIAVDTVVIVICAHLYALTLLSSVFGDGYSEVARHLHLGLNAALLAFAVLPQWLWRRRRDGVALLRAHRLALAMLLLWLALCAYSLLRLPLAFGVLAEPRAVLPRSGVIELTGWALDARPLQRLFVRVDDHEVASLQRVVRPRLERMFPYLEEATAGGFSGSFDARVLDGGKFLQILAIDAGGHEVIIERRRIR